YRIEIAGLNPFQLVLVGTVLELAAFSFEIPTGVLADTYSRRLSVILGLALLGAAEMLEGSIPLFAFILQAQVISGLGYTFISGASEAWVADELGEEQAGRAYLRGAQIGQIGTLLGTFASVGLASIALNLPLLVGGAALITLAVVLLFVMPEHGFQPLPREERGSWRAMGGTFREGVATVRGRPLLMIILSIAIFFGASTEAFDRLWQAHLLENFSFPELGALQPVVWFGIINVGAMLISFVATEIAQRRLDTTNHHVVARALLLINSLLIASLIGFGLAGGFAVALSAYWAATLLRRLNGPLYTAWLNQNVNPRVRATVFSMSGQADALGQVAVGPVIGAVGAAVSLRAAMVLGGLLLSPALALYARALRRDRPAEFPASTPEL
ncbi:MAG TPA: MFS transporter, partial [Roseiflexaceae bacterium]|nr:MFS transporter [Roseiflexaceae bacterium]